MGKVHTITSIQDLDRLFSLSKGTFYTIKFGASWCQPCKEIKDRYDNLSKNYKNIVFIDIDIDNDNTDNTMKISDYFNISNLPTIIIVKSEGNLPPNKNVNNLILKKIEGSDLSPLIYFLNNINYEINSNNINENNSSIDRFEPPNINFTREIGYNSNVDNDVYGHFINEKDMDIYPSGNNSSEYSSYN